MAVAIRSWIITADSKTDPNALLDHNSKGSAAKLSDLDHILRLGADKNYDARLRRLIASGQRQRQSVQTPVYWPRETRLSICHDDGGRLPGAHA